MNIILSPKYEQLKNDINKLHIELTMLVTERDELLHVECKNIEMQYLLLFGAKEYSVFSAQCQYLRLKRKVSLIQAKLNRQEKIDIEFIEKVLDKEFEEFQQQLDEKIKKIDKALYRNSLDTMSKEQEKALKKMYYEIVKKLHPDMNPDLTESMVNLFYKAVQAYEDGDLNTISIIYDMAMGTITDVDYNSIEELKNRKSNFQSLIANVKDSINTIKSVFPYTAKELILDEEKIESYIKELDETLKSYNQIIEAYKNKLEIMLGGGL